MRMIPRADKLMRKDVTLGQMIIDDVAKLRRTNFYFDGSEIGSKCQPSGDRTVITPGTNRLSSPNSGVNPAAPSAPGTPIQPNARAAPHVSVRVTSPER
jgi:hypothetical protein